MSTIVVGIDGSDASKLALRWAVDEARLRKAAVRAVHVWQYPASAAWAGMFVDFYDELARASVDFLEQAMAETVQDTDVQIERRVVCGLPAASLVDASADADMLVVGSRGLGGFKGLLLGSVSHQCIHHATCPVVVVHQPAAASESAEDVVEARESRA